LRHHLRAGFGVVYMAEQTEPVRRKVALKVIKPGMDTQEVIARFEAERQALALMDRPNLKPSNVLVTLHDGTPVPKIIDFGVAKALCCRLTDKTMFTHYGQVIGTPQYMSPEQAEMSGLDIDTRSDIYSLGVLLYELLTGRPPFDSEQLAGVGIDEMRRVIREKEPRNMASPKRIDCLLNPLFRL
jgi:serine/threonine protein kinase